MLYAAERTHKDIQRLGHYFKPDSGLENKLGLAAANYECVQSIPKIVEYVDSVGWDGIIAHEEKIQGNLLEYLTSRPDITIFGESSADAGKRVPVISFGVKGRNSKEIVEAVEQSEGGKRFGFRWGHFYSKRLVDDVLGLPESMDGVVRVSLVHYNTGMCLRSCGL